MSSSDQDPLYESLMSVLTICSDRRTIFDSRIKLTYNHFRYAKQAYSTNKIIKLPTPFHSEELSKLFNVEMKPSFEEKGIYHTVFLVLETCIKY